jgi:ferredoxin/flavodoxin
VAEDQTIKGAICFYSAAGNTKLACQAIARAIRAVEFDLLDITKTRNPDLGAYDIVGFATFADFFGPPQFFVTFTETLPVQPGKPAFVFNTWGGMSGGTLRRMTELVTARGFRVLAAHSLHTPESYPPMIARGRPFTAAPNADELRKFRDFTGALNLLCRSLKDGAPVPRPLRLGLLDRLLPVLSRTTARREMGIKYVDADLCTTCGICVKLCPYGAIELREKPVFDVNKCYGCWACFHHCPSRAIYTWKFRGIGHYPEPAAELRAKLLADDSSEGM